MFLSHIDVSLSLSPSLPLFLKSVSMSSGEYTKKKVKAAERFPPCTALQPPSLHSWILEQLGPVHESVPREHSLS